MGLEGGWNVLEFWAVGLRWGLGLQRVHSSFLGCRGEVSIRVRVATGGGGGVECTRVMGCRVEVSIKVRVVKWGWRGLECTRVHSSSGL